MKVTVVTFYFFGRELVRLLVRLPVPAIKIIAAFSEEALRRNSGSAKGFCECSFTSLTLLILAAESD